MNAIELEKRSDSIEFNNVNFGYKAENMILKNVSFKVEPGQTIALVGF